MALTPEQEAKLPKYAREELKALRQQVAHLEYVLDGFQGSEPSRIFIEHGSVSANNRETQYLRDRERVIFKTTEGDLSIYLNSERTISIMGDTTLWTRPQSTNVFQVGMMTREEERNMR